MRILACGLIVGAALLGATPVAMAEELTHHAAGANSVGASSDGQVAPQAEVSLLAVSLTVGGAVAMAGSGAALALARRRRVSPPS